MEHKLDQQNDISLAPEKRSLTLETLDNSSTDQHSAIRSTILNSTDTIRKNEKHVGLNTITERILKTEVSTLDQDFIDMMISELSNQNLIENRRTLQGLHSFHRVLSISPEQEEVYSSLIYGRCNNISSQPIETDSVSNETVHKIAPDSRTPKINKKRQSKTEKHNSKETHTDFPDICHSSSSINKDKILSKYVRTEADLSTLKSHVKCKLLNMMIKMESLINSASNGYLCKSCENMKGNLSFLLKELFDSNNNSKLTIKFNIEASILVIIT